METRKRKQKTKIDPLYYADFAEDTASVKDIEARFATLEFFSRKCENQEEAVRKTFLWTADPNQMPLEIWNSLDSITGDQDESFDDQDYIAGEDFYDEMGDMYKNPVFYSRPGSKRKTSDDLQFMGSEFAIEHIGEGIEIWPSYRLRRFLQPDGARETTEFTYVKEIVPYEQFSHKVATKHIVNKITAQSVMKIVNAPTAIVMDPPSDKWGEEDYFDFFSSFRELDTQVYFAIWVDSRNLTYVSKAVQRSKCMLCDLVAVQLHDGVGATVCELSKGGLAHSARSFVIIRTCKGVFKIHYQQTKDYDQGVVIPAGKSDGRDSYPEVINNCIEKLLEDKDAVFVELWPSLWANRPGWIYIDEKVE